MVDALQTLSEQKENLHITHQTGEADFERVSKKYKENNFSSDIRPFIDDIGDQYRKASLVLCRAGATTLAEVTACGKMSILVPFPHAAHNHQEKNARILEAANAGDLVIFDTDMFHMGGLTKGGERLVIRSHTSGKKRKL